MNKTFKKVLSVVLSLAMVITSITVYNTTAKADEEVAVTATVNNGMIDASWSHPSIEFVTEAFYLNKADNIVLDAAHYAKAANGYVWTINAPTGLRTALDTVVSTNDGSVNVSDGGDFVITVQYFDADGNVVASGTSNVVSTETVVNTDLNLRVERYETNIAYLKWDLIKGAAKYEVYNADTNELMKTQNSATTDWTDVAIQQGVTYNLVVKAIDANGSEIEITNNTATAYQEVEEQTTASDVPDTKPEENDITKVDTSSWVALEVKGGTVEDSYAVNAAHGLSQAVWWGIYAPHSEAAYHNERTNCILGDAAAFVFQRSDVVSIWVNGVKYANPSTAFNNQGDCCELSVDVLEDGQNVITLVHKNGTMATFAIKVSAPMGADATEPAQQDTIDPATITDWIELAGTSDNGSKAYISQAAADLMGNGALRGFYPAGQSTNWNISDKMKEQPVFGFVAANGNPSSIIINGVEYVNAKDQRNEKVFIGNDCVYINQELVEAGIGETKYYTITAVGNPIGTFLMKVEGAAPVVKYNVTVDGITTEVEEGQTYTLGDAEYGYYADGQMYKAGTVLTITGDITLTSVNELSVTMAGGAAIKTSTPAGLKFQATVNSNNADAVKSDAIKEGMLITANDIFENNNSVLDLTSAYTKLNIENSGWANADTMTYCGAVANIVEQNYVRGFIARAYVTVSYTDGTSTTIYSDMGSVRSVSQVASAVQNAGYPGLNATEISVIDSFIK